MTEDNGQETGFTIFPDNNGKGTLLCVEGSLAGLTFNPSCRGADPQAITTMLMVAMDTLIQSGQFELNERCIHYDFRRPVKEPANQAASPPPPPPPPNSEWEEFNQDIDAELVASPTGSPADNAPHDLAEIKAELKANHKIAVKNKKITKKRLYAYVEMITPKEIKQKDKPVLRLLEMQALMYDPEQPDLQQAKFAFFDNWDHEDEDMKWKNPFYQFNEDIGRELWANRINQTPVRVATIIAVNPYKNKEGKEQFSLAQVIEPDEIEEEE